MAACNDKAQVASQTPRHDVFAMHSSLQCLLFRLSSSTHKKGQETPAKASPLEIRSDNETNLEARRRHHHLVRDCRNAVGIFYPSDQPCGLSYSE